MGAKERWIPAIFLLLSISATEICRATDSPPTLQNQALGTKCLNNSLLNQLHSSLQTLSERASRLMNSAVEPDSISEGSPNYISNTTLADFWAQLGQLELFLRKFENITIDTSKLSNISEILGSDSSKNPTEHLPDNPAQQDLQIEALNFSVYNLQKDIQHLSTEVSDFVKEDGENFELENTRMLALAGEISAIQNSLVWLGDNITYVSTWIAKLGARVENHQSDIDELNELVVSLGSSLAEEISKSHFNITALENRINQLSAAIDSQNPPKSYKQGILQSIQDTKVKVKDNVINPKYGNSASKDEGSSFFSQLFSMGGQNNAALPKSGEEDLLSNLTQEVLQMGWNLEELQEAHSSFASEVNNKIAAIETRLNREDHEGGMSETSLPSHSQITNETCNGLRRHLVGNSCYFVPDLATADHQFTWWDARYLCKQHNNLGPKADLVAIETKAKMDDIIKLVSNHFGGIEEFWLGASDLQEEGNWVWVLTGEALNQNSYTNWQHAPDKNTEVNCMSMFTGFQWAAEPCFYERYPICELKLD